MILIYVASPYSGEIEKNIEFAKRSCEFVLKQGHGFFAPHLIYTQILDDSDLTQRKKGLEMGLTLLSRCDELWVFGDHISKGMKTEIQFAQEHEIPIRHITTEELLSQEKLLC